MNRAITIGAGLFIFACGMTVGAIKAANDYEGEIARADQLTAEARGFREMKACAGILQGGWNLVEVIRNDRAFFACVTDVAERTEERVAR